MIMDYKEKLEEAKRLYKTANVDQRYVLESLFPELAESEDERIRKCVKYAIDKLFFKEKIVCDVHKDNVIAWFEKQGESYTKRDVDDAFVEGMAFAKNELEKQDKQKVSYTTLVKTGNGGINALVTRDLEIPYGAKDSELQEATYFIPKGYYANIEGDKVVIKKGEQNLANSAKTCKKSQRMISAEAKEALYDKPATIDIDKMVDAYANNEEFGKPLNCMIRAYRQGLKDAIWKVVSESAWSEEDEEMLGGIILRCEKYGHQEQINWLKSLKERIGG